MNTSITRRIIFRFEASIKIGAGHAIRSMVLANHFKKLNWTVLISTTTETYDFISDLTEFKRIEPSSLLDGSQPCTILVIDSYDIDVELEKKFRKYAKKILVIDDLANRPHDCDILVDQTYGRLKLEYQNWVPNNCKILTGSDFILIRDEFLKYRDRALTKRKSTTKVKKVLISLGGWDQKGLTHEVLKKLIETGYDGEIDIVTGFENNLNIKILKYIKELPNIVNIYTCPDIPKLMFEADFAITASGSSVWERCFLGLPGSIVLTVENQSLIYKNLITQEMFYSMENLQTSLQNPFKAIEKIFSLCDGMGALRVKKVLLRNQHD